MPQYRVLAKSFINDALYEEGAIVDYTPPEGTEVGDNLDLIDAKSAPKAKAAE